MNINLNNYEQYLLMYVDNELSAAERMQVEEFLRDYPYLTKELEILQQTVLPLENVLFDKTSLLKPILDENTQEKLLMHLDGELMAGESLVFQKSLEADNMLQKEWAILQTTKLDRADIIEFPDKESLYRKERTRVVTFVRWAAAAMLIGAGLYAGFNLVNTGKPGNIDVAANDPAVNTKNGTGVAAATNNTTTVLPGKTNEDPDTTNDTQDEKLPVVNNAEKTLNNNMLASTSAADNKKKKNDAAVTGSKNNVAPDVAVSDLQPENKKQIIQPKELPQRFNENILKSNNDVAALEKLKPNNEIDLPSNINTSSKPIVDKLLTESSNSYARTASLGFEENNQDQILMMEEENVSRSKAAIFLKKLKRNVERRANMKPGKSLRIAGFEFAVK